MQKNVSTLCLSLASKESSEYQGSKKPLCIFVCYRNSLNVFVSFVSFVFKVYYTAVFVRAHTRRRTGYYFPRYLLGIVRIVQEVRGI